MTAREMAFAAILFAGGFSILVTCITFIRARFTIWYWLHPYTVSDPSWVWYGLAELVAGFALLVYALAGLFQPDGVIYAAIASLLAPASGSITIRAADGTTFTQDMLIMFFSWGILNGILQYVARAKGERGF
jgi:hypothetical protein